jgi:hypothetical protein
LIVAAALPVLAQSDAPEFFRVIAKGEWTVTYRDGSPLQKICVKTGEELIQIKHREAQCSRFVVEESPSKITVQYTCRGDGYGRTEIRRENASLVQIESQGIATGLPFELAAEARLTGSC